MKNILRKIPPIILLIGMFCCASLSARPWPTPAQYRAAFDATEALVNGINLATTNSVTLLDAEYKKITTNPNYNFDANLQKNPRAVDGIGEARGNALATKIGQRMLAVIGNGTITEVTSLNDTVAKLAKMFFLSTPQDMARAQAAGINSALASTEQINRAAAIAPVMAERYKLITDAKTEATGKDAKYMTAATDAEKLLKDEITAITTGAAAIPTLDEAVQRRDLARNVYSGAKNAVLAGKNVGALRGEKTKFDTTFNGGTNPIDGTEYDKYFTNRDAVTDLITAYNAAITIAVGTKADTDAVGASDLGRVNTAAGNVTTAIGTATTALTNRTNAWTNAQIEANKLPGLLGSNAGATASNGVVADLWAKAEAVGFVVTDETGGKELKAAVDAVKAALGEVAATKPPKDADWQDAPDATKLKVYNAADAATKTLKPLGLIGVANDAITALKTEVGKRETARDNLTQTVVNKTIDNTKDAADDHIKADDLKNLLDAAITAKVPLAKVLEFAVGAAAINNTNINIKGTHIQTVIDWAVGKATATPAPATAAADKAAIAASLNALIAAIPVGLGEADANKNVFDAAKINKSDSKEALDELQAAEKSFAAYVGLLSYAAGKPRTDLDAGVIDAVKAKLGAFVATVGSTAKGFGAETASGILKKTAKDAADGSTKAMTVADLAYLYLFEQHIVPVIVNVATGGDTKAKLKAAVVKAGDKDAPLITEDAKKLGVLEDITYWAALTMNKDVLKTFVELLLKSKYVGASDAEKTTALITVFLETYIKHDAPAKIGQKASFAGMLPTTEAGYYADSYTTFGLHGVVFGRYTDTNSLPELVAATNVFADKGNGTDPVAAATATENEKIKPKTIEAKKTNPLAIYKALFVTAMAGKGGELDWSATIAGSNGELYNTLASGPDAAKPLAADLKAKFNDGKDGSAKGSIATKNNVTFPDPYFSALKSININGQQLVEGADKDTLETNIPIVMSALAGVNGVAMVAKLADNSLWEDASLGTEEEQKASAKAISDILNDATNGFDAKLRGLYNNKIAAGKLDAFKDLIENLLAAGMAPEAILSVVKPDATKLMDAKAFDDVEYYATVIEDVFNPDLTKNSDPADGTISPARTRFANAIADLINKTVAGDKSPYLLAIVQFLVMSDVGLFSWCDKVFPLGKAGDADSTNAKAAIDKKFTDAGMGAAADASKVATDFLTFLFKKVTGKAVTAGDLSEDDVKKFLAAVTTAKFAAGVYPAGSILNLLSTAGADNDLARMIVIGQAREASADKNLAVDCSAGGANQTAYDALTTPGLKDALKNTGWVTVAAAAAPTEDEMWAWAATNEVKDEEADLVVPASSGKHTTGKAIIAALKAKIDALTTVAVEAWLDGSSNLTAEALKYLTACAKSEAVYTLIEAHWEDLGGYPANGATLSAKAKTKLPAGGKKTALVTLLKTT